MTCGALRHSRWLWRGCSALASYETIQRSTLTLRRPACSRYTVADRWQTQLSGLRRSEVLVEKRGLGAWTAPLGQGQDADDALHPRQRDRQPIADVHGPRRLHRLIVDVHLAAVAGGGRQRTALEEPRGPQPLVNTDFVHGGGLTVPYGTPWPAAADSSSTARRY